MEQNLTMKPPAELMNIQKSKRVRIPYTQFDNLNIEDLQLQTTKFLLKKEGDY